MPKRDLDMKGDWNRRAIDNARYYIATPVDDDEQAFERSGERDVAAFFSGLEHLLHAEQTVLDIGCGIGRMDQFVAPRVSRLCGIDVSGEMVQRARVCFAHLDNVEFVEGDGWTLAPIPDASVGLVFSHIVFQHMPREVLGRGDHRHDHPLPVRRVPDLLEDQAVRVGREVIPVRSQLRVVGEESVLADVVAEELFRALKLRDRSGREQDGDGQSAATETKPVRAHGADRRPRPGGGSRFHHPRRN